MTDLAIQIVNYKTKAFLTALISSIATDVLEEKLNIEINILENASGDNLDDLPINWSALNINVYNSESNKGFGAGHNFLSRQTKAKLLLILNPDLLFFEKNTIVRLLNSYEKNGAAVLGPRLLTPKSRSKKDLQNLNRGQLKQQAWDHGIRSIAPYHVDNKLTSVAWVSGAVFLINQQLFYDMGGFDEKFFMYFEELDLCDSIRAINKTVIYDPSIQILHFGSASATKISIYWLKSYLYYNFKLLKRAFKLLKAS